MSSIPSPANTVQPDGTLTIQVLLNARGVGDTTGTAPATTIPDDEPQADEIKPDKDGNG